MPGQFSLRGLSKSLRSKIAGNPDDSLPLDDTTTLTGVSETTQGEEHTLMTPEVSSSHNITESRAVSKVPSSSIAKLQPPSKLLINDTQGTPITQTSRVTKSLLPIAIVQESCEDSSSHTAQPEVIPSFVPIPSTKEVKESQPPTGCSLQQSQAISTSQRLWNDAYERLEKDEDNSQLVEDYVKTLEMVFRDRTSASGDSDISTELKDPVKRQLHMKTLLVDGQMKIFRSSNFMKGAGDVAQFILSTKTLVDSAIQSIPQAALPWAGVCVGLQILMNPGKATGSNLSGIAYVISRMEWYCGLSEHLLSKDNIVVGSQSLETILLQLEKTIVALYKALLVYQMKSACMYYRNRGLVFLRSLANLDDWERDLKTVTDAEFIIGKDADQYSKEHAKSSLGQLVKNGERMEALLGDVHQTLRDFITLQKNMHRDEEDTNCLRELFVVDPQDDMDTIEMKKDTILYDAYKWIFDTKEYLAFTNWGLEESSLSPCRLLWVKGHAGTGKTMILIGIIRQLSDQVAVLSPNVSHFFCQATDDKTHNNATAILRTLIWMLIIQQPYLISHLQPKYKHKGDSLFRDGNALVAMSRVFESMLKDPNLSRVYFIVDALDECDEGLEVLFRLISTSLALSTKVKWLVSSRPEVDVHTQLKNPDILKNLVELDAQSLESPVKTYINHKICALRDNIGYNDEILAEISKMIHERAENTFLWVALVFKELGPDERFDPIKIIEDIPPGLSNLYDHMMNRIENGRDQQYYKSFLVAATLALRPLSMSELAVLAGLPRAITGTKIKMLISKCRSFLITRNETVYLVHTSAKDYLDANYTCRLQQGGTGEGHADIIRRSIDAMSRTMKKNIYSLPNVGFKSADITIPSPDPLDGLRYSCVYWVQHLQKSKALISDSDQVHRFLQKHLLHWLETLSCIGKTSEGILAILFLETYVLVDKNPTLSAFMHDAKRFALHNRHIVEHAPLQIYCSALIFAPEKSIVRKQFEKCIPSWIFITPRAQENWNATLQTLEGHVRYVTSVNFSPDGKYIVSGSWDHTIRLWDAVTGAALQILKGHEDTVSSVAFSPDSKYVVSGSWDCTVRLWDADTGAALQKLEGHSSAVVLVAFLPDHRQIISQSWDRTVRIWNAISGVELQKIENHTDSVTSAFSPDCRYVVSGLKDHTVRICDMVTSVELQKLEGHTDSVTSVAFSSDGKHIVSGSQDCTIRLWDSVTGTTLQILEGHTGYVASVAFSLDGKNIVSGSWDQTVRLWDAIKGTILQTLEGHTGYVASVAFSPDSKQVVSGSWDRAIRLWDAVTASTGIGTQKPQGHSDSVAAVAISLDGKHVGSGSRDCTVRIWDGVTGAMLRTLEGHAGYISSVEFSSDGNSIASGSGSLGDYTVRLWDTTTGAALQTLEGHTSYVASVAFSPDGKYVVSGSGDHTVRLWDAITGVALQTLDGHTAAVSLVKFSPDGKYIVSGAWDRTVRLWDAVTGIRLQTLEDFKDSVNTMGFLPDNKNIVFWPSRSEDRTVHFWDTVTGIVSSGTFPLGSDKSMNNLLVLDDWVVEGDSDVIWLPSNYRATCVAKWDKGLALGNSSGRISLLGLEKGPYVI